MNSLYFECNNGISGDMAVASLIDLGANKDELIKALKSLNMEDEFEYKITDVLVNSIKAVDFDVILKHHHHDYGNEHNHHHTHRNLDDINKIIDKVDMSENARNLAKKIFKIVATAESKVHNKSIEEVHFHEIGAIDSIVDIVSFSVLFDSLNIEKVYFSTLTEGTGTVECQHGTLNIPVPAVVEILSEYKIPLKIIDEFGEKITPTGAAIVASLYSKEKLDKEIIIEKIGTGHGKRPYKNPTLRTMLIKTL